MKTFRVRMNEIESQDSNRKPLGMYYRHINSHSLSSAKRDAERLFYGSCESVTPKALTSKDFKVEDMIDGQAYEILADSSFTNDTVIFKKQGNIIYSTIRGGEFPEVGFTRWYNLSIIKLLENTIEINLEHLTLEELEWLDFEVYNEITMLKEMPVQFADIYGEG